MATIGSLTASENGFSGTIMTLNLNLKAKIVRVERSSDDAPDFRVLAGKTLNSAPAGRSRPARASATTSRSSSTTQASLHRSTRR